MLRERIEAIRTIWTEDEASYHGEFVDFERIWSWPKPVQKPGPPVLVGGNGAEVLDRVLAFGDGWFPNRIGAEENNIARIEELQRRAAEAGRDPIPVSIQIPRATPTRCAATRPPASPAPSTCSAPTTPPTPPRPSASSTSGRSESAYAGCRRGIGSRALDDDTLLFLHLLSAAGCSSSIAMFSAFASARSSIPAR